VNPFPDFSSAHILVVGDIMLDRYWHGGTSRISPEAPVPVVHVTDEEDRPGGAANVALNISALGGQAHLLGVTGNDSAAETLQHLLGQQQVECHFVRLPSVRTITKLRVLSRHQQLLRLDFESPLHHFDHTQLVATFEQLLQHVDAVVLSDYAKGTLAGAATLIRLARAAGKPVLVDPKGSDFSKYQGATVITPNCAEFETIVGVCADQDDMAHKGEHLRAHLHLEALLITRSEKGMTLLRRDHAPVHLPAHAREVFDVTGAGDTVIGVLATALAAQKDMRDAVALANLAAGLVVAKLGAACVSAAELTQALTHHHDNQGILSEAHLRAAVAAARAHGETVVMTNGCFDILHAGHVHYLEQARTLGDRLIVAINDDASVSRLKGATRPINPLAERMAVIAGLSAVDWVVAFSEDTPERLICTILPDVLVKGGDYRVEDIAGHRCVVAHGGHVRVLEFKDNCSTSAIVRKISQNSL
jgi:D-beta-D-heptose 7-phosphate kinase / D-beta-D-heptose 1-phosphate adenosyltransferase